MTTETTPRPGLRVLLRAALAGCVVVVAAVSAGAVVDGRAAALGAAAGGVVALAVFALGTSVVHVVSEVLPRASLLVALLTYTLQLLVMVLVLTGMHDTVVGASATGRGWFAAAVIAVTAGWLLTQLRLATRLRIPAFEGGAP